MLTQPIISSKAKGNGGGKMARILVVDDEADIVLLIKKILQSAGHEVIGAGSGEEALERLRGLRPDLILLDIMMPGLDGWETLRQMRGQKGLEDIPVAMLTAKPLTAETAGRRDIEELVDYIEKPFTKETLIQKVNYSIIEDLDRIEREKSRLLSASGDRGMAAAYERAARRERLHRSMVATLKESLSRTEDPGERSKLREAISTGQKTLEGFKSYIEELESLTGKT
ncbi:MAG: response regulator [Methanobacteriota archaeon]|nr:MAG: response regulator [Euryarchaeota archaeon]